MERWKERRVKGDKIMEKRGKRCESSGEERENERKKKSERGKKIEVKKSKK